MTTGAPTAATVSDHFFSHVSISACFNMLELLLLLLARQFFALHAVLGLCSLLLQLLNALKFGSSPSLNTSAGHFSYRGRLPSSTVRIGATCTLALGRRRICQAGHW